MSKHSISGHGKPIFDVFREPEIGERSQVNGGELEITRRLGRASRMTSKLLTGIN